MASASRFDYKPLSQEEAAFVCSDNAALAAEQIGNAIGLSDDVLNLVARADEKLDIGNLLPLLNRIYVGSDVDEAVSRLVLLADDNTGMSVLACYLRCLTLTRNRYRVNGIPDNVFVNTQRFFSRFIERYRSVHGKPRFDQEFWATRQISMRIFRICELEFELVDGSHRYVGIHIPADARLDAAGLSETFSKAAEFIALHFPAFVGADFMCDSWLLDPALDDLLPENSRIRYFRDLFTVYGLQYSDDYKLWVYGRCDVDNVHLSEGTHLQRSIKAYVLNGGVMGIGHGILKQTRKFQFGINGKSSFIQEGAGSNA